MKIVAQPIDAIVCFMGEEMPKPYRFRCREAGGEETAAVKIDHICDVERTNVAGAPALVYRCQSEISGIMKAYELRYFLRECRWELYKI